MSQTISEHTPTEACERCPVWRPGALKRLGLNMDKWDYVVALAGNPNTGKSTVFNALTGLHQHTGNWPGKTISRAEGGFSYSEKNYKIVDLPGTYSLRSTSTDEEVAREFILFGQPDVTVVVCDATSLERNLNLLLQVRQITGRVVVALNLMDEARSQKIEIDTRNLARELGVPVVPMVARSKEGLPELLKSIHEMATGMNTPKPRTASIQDPSLAKALKEVKVLLRGHTLAPSNEDWIALRLLEGDSSMETALRDGTLGSLSEDHAGSFLESEARKEHGPKALENSEELLKSIEGLRWEVHGNSYDAIVESLYAEAEGLASRYVQRHGHAEGAGWRTRLDAILTGKWTGLPVMALMLLVVLWLTIAGANVPSGMLATLLIDHGHALLKDFSTMIGLPWWLDGLLVDGMYLTLAWVVSVMLPPMAIFFPLFTLLEDFGYLPRVAYNLDGLFKRSGAHGKQSLSMAMGFGCNAAGIIATRIIDSPRERLIAILTNNFALCNGRWPTQILIGTIFIGALAPAGIASLVAAGSVFAIASLGIILTFVVSFGLSKTLLRGEASAFTLELPPYRPPNILRTLYTSLIDRTVFVLWRAIVFAVPAGIIIWSICNINIGDLSVAEWSLQVLDPIAWPLGLTGVILLAYVVAIPANEIVIPTILMLTVMATGMSVEEASGAGVMFETDDSGVLYPLLKAGGWTTLTAICLMLFSLCHNPCSTTLYTIYKETGSLKWTTWSAVIPTVMGIVICLVVATLWRLVV
ncbi:ferrous iron transport protein B [Puniceicoccales bacterium CK1056]|uniref:Ferrous iron transport protein B n=1 Tax=Oceanipulchritudo coccoides TaxID=2706888 RepID=A0A6B2M5I0_9BACT|nr:ferrous iron transport protein B [Oceanipulchritudo coccoides]NDV62930.1 ferrous iron transport protein B [Oceanipulchritudo coccoides]